MSKQKPKFKPTIQTREKLPLTKKEKDGIVLLCPFCDPSHPIVPGQPNACGTTLRVTAVQQIFNARTVRMNKMICVKCGQGGGQMVQYFNGYLHLEDCNPEVQMLTQIPKYSRWAEIVYKFPEWLRDLFEKYTGVVQIVREMTPEGVETGEVQGYFFRPKSLKGA